VAVVIPEGFYRELMNILFIHQNFPGQYKHLAPLLAANQANRVFAMHMRPDLPTLPGITAVRSTVSRGNTPGIHPWLEETESKVIRGEAAWQTASTLRDSGFVPDVICAHPGWGESLFVKDVWPEARLLCIFEFYYHVSGQDVGFDPEYPTMPDDACRQRLKNGNNLLALEACDAGISPTHYQRSLHPAEYRDKISVIHDGIDTDAVVPDPGIALTLKDRGVTLTCRDEVITFVNRNLEPYRGWHVFARALPKLLARRPRAHVLIVGGDDVSYGSRPADGVSYKQRYLAEVIDRLDLQRVHFLGRIPYASLLAVLQLSSAHVYLTYPFVLSWSMLEAMSAGALVIGSRTAPVEEVIRHGDNGLLVDFFSPDDLAAAVDEVLSHPDRMQALRDNARRTVVERYDLRRVCLPQHQALIQRLAENRNASG
jgi:glycosyltransferase involved in cell wall biosynthesis